MQSKRKYRETARRLTWAVAAALISGFGVPAAAQESVGVNTEVPVTLARAMGPIQLDGRLDEAAWDGAESVPLSVYSPVFRGEPTQDTDIRLLYDDQYFYVGGRLYDDEPDQIRTNTFYRDAYSGDDLLAIVVDSYNDYETALWFAVNPAGTRTDRSLSNDGEFDQGDPMNADWNSHWDVATHQDEDGWYAEMRIPFSTLGFQAPDGEVTMGIMLYRFIARNNERYMFPEVDPEWSGIAFAKPSRAQRIRMTGVEQSKPVYVTPYTLGGLNTRPVLQEDLNGGWSSDTDYTREIGGDLRFSPTSNLSVDVTLNTDFAQVEADDQQINLTRFPLFFPEKRQFFQERSSTFDFNTGGFFDRLFNSRQIGLVNGEITRIYGGGRAVGRIGGTDFGVLNMQTGAAGGLDGENMGVVRLSQQVFNPYSSVGGMLTTRFGAPEKENVAYGLDATIRTFGNEYLITKWAQTFDAGIDEESALESASILAQWQRRQSGGLSYSAVYRRVGRDYRPGLGFQTRRDFSFYGANAGYTTFPADGSAFRSVQFQVTTQNFLRNEDQSAESRRVTPSIKFDFLGGTEVTLSGNAVFESVENAFPISDISVEPGDFWYHEAELKVMLPRSDIFRGEYGVSAGSFYDGTRYSMALNPIYNVNRYLEVGGGYEVNRIEFADRDAEVTTHLIRSRLAFALNTRVSLGVLSQYNTVSDQVTFNARFRYHFREGTDLWIVFNEGLNTVLDNGLDPRLPRSAGRTLLIKYSHALVL